MVVGRPLYNKQASELSTSSQPCELSTARMPKHARNERECPAFDSNFFAPFLLMTPHQWGREFYFFWHLVLQTALHQIHPSNHRQSLHHSWWGCFPASSPSSCKGLSDAAGQALHSWPGAARSCFWSLSAFVCCTSQATPATATLLTQAFPLQWQQEILHLLRRGRFLSFMAPMGSSALSSLVLRNIFW